jgi:hypothetical protein
MQRITPRLTPELESLTSDSSPSKSDALPVRTYKDLLEHVARLAYLNKDYVLFYRGQDRDFTNKAGASSFYPTIYRGEKVGKAELDLRFDILASASRQLCGLLEREDIEGCRDVSRRKYIQWSILQHYGVCQTPLIDLTHSLLVACSFALLESATGSPSVFVFGMPFITNRVSINSEQDLVMIRLLSICPPKALRPYYQEGYLAGTDEVTNEYESKDELDLNRRLIAKFRISGGATFWGKGMSPIQRSMLYPGGDRVEEICKEIVADVGDEHQPGQLGLFLRTWSEIEALVLTLAREERPNVYSLGQALPVLMKSQRVPKEALGELDELRRLRNLAVHYPMEVPSSRLSSARQTAEMLRTKLAGRRRSPTLW